MSLDMKFPQKSELHEDWDPCFVIKKKMKPFWAQELELWSAGQAKASREGTCVYEGGGERVVNVSITNKTKQNREKPISGGIALYGGRHFIGSFSPWLVCSSPQILSRAEVLNLSNACDPNTVTSVVVTPNHKIISMATS